MTLPAQPNPCLVLGGSLTGAEKPSASITQPAACLEAALQALATGLDLVCTVPSAQNTNLVVFPQTVTVFCVVLVIKKIFFY